MEHPTPEAVAVPLNNGSMALVDVADYPLVSHYKWGSWKGYVRVHYGGKVLLMHRLILGVVNSSDHVDHINGNPSDNRRCNLRVCTHAENLRNRRKQKNTSSVYKGVCASYKGKWRATIRTNGIKQHLGCFGSEIDAARAYDAAARESFGEFAKTNF